MNRFEAMHGTCNCRQLLDGCDLATEEGQRAFKEHDFLNRKCKVYVETVVAILEQIAERMPTQP